MATRVQKTIRLTSAGKNALQMLSRQLRQPQAIVLERAVRELARKEQMRLPETGLNSTQLAEIVAERYAREEAEITAWEATRTPEQVQADAESLARSFADIKAGRVYTEDVVRQRVEENRRNRHPKGTDSGE